MGGENGRCLNMDGTHFTFMEEISKFMEEHSIFMEGHSKVIRQFERVPRVNNKVLAHTIKTVFYVQIHCFTRICQKFYMDFSPTRVIFATADFD